MAPSPTCVIPMFEAVAYSRLCRSVAASLAVHWLANRTVLGPRLCTGILQCISADKVYGSLARSQTMEFQVKAMWLEV